MRPIRELTGATLPPRLRDLPAPPERLYVVGELPRGPIVAIVGTRTPTAEAASYARSLSSALARAGVVVASGGAKGIDTEVHQGALDAKGATLVVAPASFDRPYPARNAALFESVVDSGGAYLSPFHSGVPAHPAYFFQRNAYLAALSVALVVVETRYRGGARNAAKHARRLGRLVFAVPAPPWNVVGRGCIAELQRGARALGSPKDVLRALSESNAHPLRGAPSLQLELGGAGSLDPDDADSSRSGLRRELQPMRGLAAGGDADPSPRKKSVVRTRSYSEGAPRVRLLRAIGEGRVHADEICQRTGLPPQQVQELLLTLTLEGILVSHASGHVSRVKF